MLYRSHRKSQSHFKSAIQFSLILTFLSTCFFTTPLLAKKKKNNKASAGSNYYRTQPIFLPAPQPGSKAWVIKNFGPVGIGFDLISPAFTMRIRNVEPGSPADKTGKLKKGQIVESINGKTLKEIDPRFILANIITEAEASDGKIKLKGPEIGEVLITIPIMGSYSKTWPLNCSKSDKIIRNLADLIAKNDKKKWGSVLFLLSTGEKKDLDVVKNWMKGIQTIGNYPWHKGLLGPGLCEYYLRTGDSTVLPIIKKMTEELKPLMYNGGWSGRGNSRWSYGMLNAAGVHCTTFLLLARQCGVEVDEYMLQKSLKQFYRFSAHGSVPYGDHVPEGGFRDNGKTSALAMTMSAAAQLTPEGESSIYAKARDNTALKGFYATNWFMSGHTGGGIGEIWRNTSINLISESRPSQYRSFIDERRWCYELSRRFDGSIGIGGGSESSYDATVTEGSRSWGTFFALIYTLPRKHLRLFGAPKTQWCKTYPLPKRPWGNLADDAFQSPEPIPFSNGKVQDLSNEKVLTHSSLAALSILKNPKVSDTTIQNYLHHPEFAYRSIAMRTIVQFGRTKMVLPLLKSSDPRLRQAGLLAITGMFKGKALATESLTPEMFEQVIKMLNDPKESLWVLQYALKAIKRADSKTIAQHSDRILSLLKHDDWWIQAAAVEALSPISTGDNYKKILPEIIKTIGSFNVGQALNTGKALAKPLNTASEEVKNYAFKHLKTAFDNVPNAISFPGGYIMHGGSMGVRMYIGGMTRNLPGGESLGRETPKITSRYINTGNDKDLFIYNGRFVPNAKLTGTWYPATKGITSTQDLEEKLKQIAEKEARLAKKKPNPKHKAALAKKKKSAAKNARKNAIQLSKDGQVDKSKTKFWTDDTLVDISTGEALKMILHTVDGTEYMLLEKGGFDTPDTPEGWHCGYIGYKKK